MSVKLYYYLIEIELYSYPESPSWIRIMLKKGSTKKSLTDYEKYLLKLKDKISRVYSIGADSYVLSYDNKIITMLSADDEDRLMNDEI